MKLKNNLKLLVSVLILIFVIFSLATILFGSSYADSMLLKSNENVAEDISTILNRHFTITDEEFAYMKTLTFNEMELDPINLRLVASGDGIRLNAQVENLFVLTKLEPDEIKYYVDESNQEFFNYEIGAPLDCVWLLNGIFDDDGYYVAKQRADIYRYTRVTERELELFENPTSVGFYTKDEWGEFITGYSPLYTVEGTFVGLLGVDIELDSYQAAAKHMMLTLVCLFFLIILIASILFLIFYFKYIKVKEYEVYFDFYSRMSHDMRTPMNGILGVAELAHNENNVDTLHEYFSKILDSGSYMLSLINDTLDIQKIDINKLSLNPTPVSLEELTSSLNDMLKPNAERKNIKLKIETNEECEFLADPMRFKQIFVNLVTNSIKFTKEGGEVSLSFNATRQNDNTVAFHIVEKDNGVGMSAKFVSERLFTPFEQEHNSLSTSTVGSGLGLYITKQIITLMNGSITCDSKLGIGTEFIIDLKFPMAKLEKAKACEELDIDKYLESAHVLLCEDHPLNAEITSKLLAKKGVVVDVAQNGQLGVDRFMTSTVGYYDLILMDIRMPIMGGLEASEQIRNTGRLDSRSIPIIAMTANAYQDDIKQAKKAGMNDHLAKPVSSALLYKTVAYYISKYKKN